MNKGFTVQVDKSANYLGEEDKGRTPGRIYGGTVEPGPGRPVRWLNKGRKAGEMGGNYGAILHIRKRAKYRKPRKGMGSRRARYRRGRCGHPLPPSNN